MQAFVDDQVNLPGKRYLVNRLTTIYEHRPMTVDFVADSVAARTTALSTRDPSISLQFRADDADLSRRRP